MDSPSAVDSIMEDTLRTGEKRRNHAGDETGNLWSNSGAGRNGGDGDDEDNGGEGCDSEAWETLSKSFREAQSVLDQNRVLIQQVNENHQSKIRDNLVKNVALIREINGNISKVSSLYSNLSSNFVNVVHHRRGPVASSKKNGDKMENNSS